MGRTLAYRRLFTAQLRSQTQFRGSFWLNLVVNACVTGFEIVAVLAMFRVAPSIGGFPVREALLMSALCSCGFNLADMVFGEVEQLKDYIRTGRLDSVLVRPLSALGQLLVSDFAVRKLGRAVQGVTVYVAVLAIADIHWTPGRAVLALIAPLAGALLYGAVFTAGPCVAFWWVDSGEFANAFTYGGRQFAMYPITVYEPWIRAPFGYGLGLAFAGYQPALALLGRPDPLGSPGWLAWCSLPAAAVAWVLALLLWRTGIRHYRSTGS